MAVMIMVVLVVVVVARRLMMTMALILEPVVLEAPLLSSSFLLASNNIAFFNSNFVMFASAARSQSIIISYDECTFDLSSIIFRYLFIYDLSRHGCRDMWQNAERMRKKIRITVYECGWCAYKWHIQIPCMYNILYVFFYDLLITQWLLIFLRYYFSSWSFWKTFFFKRKKWTLISIKCNR